jgi:hypothetical protein
VPALTLEKPLYVRERSDGLYRPITYLLAKFFDEIFITVFASVLFSVFVFYVIDLPGSFVLFWLTYLVTLSTGIVLAYVVATLSPNMDVANAALPTYVVRPHTFSPYRRGPVSFRISPRILFGKGICRTSRCSKSEKAWLWPRGVMVRHA